MKIKKALQTALGFEEKGNKLYLEVAKKTKNEIVKETFMYLANQEYLHIKEIKEFIEKEHPNINLLGDNPHETKEFFDTTISKFKKKITLNKTDIKVYETALNLEKSSYNFYKQEFNKANDEKTRKFFKFLMAQESAHYTLLSNTYNYIKDPANFYMEEEGWIFEG
ncbi:MAG: ferritin family protein [Candidatus Woesearchaeota archaeon]